MSLHVMEFMMDGAFIVSLITAALALVGIIGIIGGASFRNRRAGPRMFRTGSIAMAGAGLVAIIASLIGIVATDQLFGGIMMLIFGTAVSLPKVIGTSTGGAPTPAG
ncbi:hypothetical protein [Sphingomonas sp. 32-62-10]